MFFDSSALSAWVRIQTLALVNFLKLFGVKIFYNNIFFNIRYKSLSLVILKRMKGLNIRK